MALSIDHLGKAKIRRLLAAVGSAPVQDPPAGDVAEYDWRDPHYLNPDQLNRLAAGMSQAAARLAGVFTRFFSREFDVSPTSISQHFAGDLLRGLDLDGDYCLTFGPEKDPPCGFLAIPSPAVMAWATRLLGDSESAGDPDRPLSSLEESLLSDLVAAVLETFLASLRPHENLKSDAALSKGQPAIEFDLTEEVCRIVFQVNQSGKDDAHEVAFLLSCGRLAALAGKTPTAGAMPQELPHVDGVGLPNAKPSEQSAAARRGVGGPVPPSNRGQDARDTSRALMEHLQEMPVTVTARLGSATINFQEILDLAPGDVLLLDKPVHEMLELSIEGRTAFRGLAARSQGQYAIFITETAQSDAGRAQDTPSAKAPGEPKKG